MEGSRTCEDLGPLREQGHLARGRPSASPNVAHSPSAPRPRPPAPGPSAPCLCADRAGRGRRGQGGARGAWTGRGGARGARGSRDEEEVTVAARGPSPRLENSERPGPTFVCDLAAAGASSTEASTDSPPRRKSRGRAPAPRLATGAGP